LKIFPKGTQEQRERFDLLKRAYVDVRYKKDYSISKEELAWVTERVKILQELTERICKVKIASFVS
jgi:hypothetical protein